MGHSNQIGTVWQVGNSCYVTDIGAIRKSNGSSHVTESRCRYFYVV